VTKERRTQTCLSLRRHAHGTLAKVWRSGYARLVGYWQHSLYSRTDRKNERLESDPKD